MAFRFSGLPWRQPSNPHLVNVDFLGPATGANTTKRLAMVAAAKGEIRKVKLVVQTLVALNADHLTTFRLVRGATVVASRTNAAQLAANTVYELTMVEAQRGFDPDDVLTLEIVNVVDGEALQATVCQFQIEWLPG
jgi:hypothetical protein